MIFGVSGQVRHKSTCSFQEAISNIETLDKETRRDNTRIVLKVRRMAS